MDNTALSHHGIIGMASSFGVSRSLVGIILLNEVCTSRIQMVMVGTTFARM